MQGGVSLRHAALTAVIACATVVGAPVARAAAAVPQSWVVAGRTYDRVRVLETTPATVTIAHAGGMVQLDLATLPPELHQHFHYDAAKAAAWHQQARAGMAETEAIKEREAAEKVRRAELEAVRQRIAQRQAETDPDYVEFRAEVDLRPVFADYSLYLKNQGARPSCSIFAIVSVLEYEYARRFGVAEQFSEEYLIWAFQRTHPGRPINDGYNFAQLVDVLRTCGIARRSMLPDTFASYLKDENPPIAALDDAVTRRDFQVVAFNPDEEILLSKLVFALNNATPVIIGIRWPPATTLERNNLLRDQVPQSGAAHAVTLVGYRSDGTPESTVFIFRNSYGPQWGLGGYGLMSASYLQKNLLTAFCLLVPGPRESP